VSCTGEEVRKAVAARLLAFWRFFRGFAGPARGALSIRDLLAWVGFVNAVAPRIGALPAYVHGAHLILLDGIGLGIGMQLTVRRMRSGGGHECCEKQGGQRGEGTSRAAGAASIGVLGWCAGCAGAAGCVSPVPVGPAAGQPPRRRCRRRRARARRRAGRASAGRVRHGNRRLRHGSSPWCAAAGSSVCLACPSQQAQHSCSE
jgi:hypothetical protein